MADLLTFSADIARRLMRMLLHYERSLDDTPNRRKRRPIDDGGGGGAEVVRFTVYSIVGDTILATIAAYMGGASSATDEVDGQIYVVDALECLTVEEGMAGYAIYMQPVGGYPQWEIDSLCCPE